MTDFFRKTCGKSKISRAHLSRKSSYKSPYGFTTNVSPVASASCGTP